MFDRLIALTMSLTLVAGTIAQPPCCCKSPTGACRLEAQTESSLASQPSCCHVAQNAAEDQIAQKLPPCCQKAANARTSDIESGPCKCDGCLTNRPKNPLNEPAAVPRASSVDDLPPALSAGPMDPLLVVSLGESRRTLLGSLSLDRPPPDWQALLCVWVI